MGKEAVFIFVYSFNGVIEVFSGNDAAKRHKELLDEGYIHTATLDACGFIQYLGNQCNDNELIEAIYNLENKPT